eukprot:1632899-Pleurochrysis_carterae.AAC.1
MRQPVSNSSLDDVPLPRRVRLELRKRRRALRKCAPPPLCPFSPGTHACHPQIGLWRNHQSGLHAAPTTS